MNKRVELDNGNLILLSTNRDNICNTLIITEYCFNNEKLEKSMTLSIWDDMSFNAITTDKKLNKIEYEIDINHPLYFCIKRMLGNDNELIIDDDHTFEKLKKYLIIKKENDLYKFIFINSVNKEMDNYSKFNVFIKNIGPDCRSKITDVSIKFRLVDFFRDIEKILLEEYHQITLDEHIENIHQKKLNKIDKF